MYLCIYIVVIAQIPTEGDLNGKDSVEVSASLNSTSGMRRANMRIPSVPIQKQMKMHGMYGIYGIYGTYATIDNTIVHYLKGSMQ